MWIILAWKPSVRSSNKRASLTGGLRKVSVASLTAKGVAPLSLMWMRRVRQHGNEPYPVILPCLLPHADEGAVCALGYRGRKRGEVVRTRTTALQMHTRQWVGTYAGKGNGDYRGELVLALQSITAYLKHFAFPPEMALVRLDGAYGDATVVAQLLLASTPFVTRWRGYLLLEHPQIQRVLAHAPTASMARRNSGVVVDIFDGGWLEVGEDVSHVRVIVARHPDQDHIQAVRRHRECS